MQNPVALNRSLRRFAAVLGWSLAAGLTSLMPVDALAAPFDWVAGAWSQCSASCGDGVQTRTVVCQDGNGVTVPDSLCVPPKPATSQPCNLGACPVYTWQVGAWSQCSASCGDGVQTRVVVCQDSNGISVPDSLCTPPKPATSRACNLGACPLYTWQAGAWSQCSASCGDGVQTRTVVCQDGNGVTVPDLLCTPPKPATSRACNLGACPVYTWEVGAWSECSATCGTGTRSRAVVCRDGGGAAVSDSLCPAPKPAVSEVCSLPPCGPPSQVPLPLLSPWLVGSLGGFALLGWPLWRRLRAPRDDS